VNPGSREPAILLAAGILVLAWSGFAPKDRAVWLLEVFPAIAGAVALELTCRRFPMTPLAYRLVFFFSLILMVGGKYTYAEVPLGLWVKDLLHLQRNHFDRLGHFFQGVIPAILTREMLIRCTPLRPGKALFWICASVALAVSACYELVEWQSAIWTAPEQGTAFLGTQGDEWDAQKDMLTALLGSLTVQLGFGSVHDRQLAALPARETLRGSSDAPALRH
jgi:putative membrane protein